MRRSNTIILIHGNFVNHHAWAHWKAHYEARGYTVYTPANPGHEGTPADLRQNVHPDLGATGFVDIVERLEQFIDTLPEEPFVVGHSMAGLAVMKLVERGKAVAGVSLHGAPPKNVAPVPFQTLRTALPSIGLLSRKKTWLGPRSWYDYAFFNTLPEAQRQAAYDRSIVPESFKVGRQLLFHRLARVDFSKPHVPLLFVGGGSDHIFPTSLTKRIARQYKDPQSSVDVKIFEGRSHFTCGEPGWEHVADYILDWYEGLPSAQDPTM
ncbi:MAG: alpha/beta fold hydrolase [Bacteroidota bacterium]